jgi:hypothetical protein
MRFSPKKFDHQFGSAADPVLIEPLLDDLQSEGLPYREAISNRQVLREAQGRVSGNISAGDRVPSQPGLVAHQLPATARERCHEHLIQAGLARQ